jgi:nicotinamide mononucleotide (NMN) deamidase PncC
VSFLESELRRLSEVCQSLGKQNRLDASDIDDSLTSDAANRPLSANQGRILNEKISTIAGYFEGGSAKTAKLAAVSATAKKLENARTIGVSLSGFVFGSGTANFDGSGNIGLAIATQAPRDFSEDNLTSVAGNRPLSANQGRILNEKISTIAGYFEGGSAKTAKLAEAAATAKKLENARTIGVSLSGFVFGSGTASFDGSGSISLAIATEERREWEKREHERREREKWEQEKREALAKVFDRWARAHNVDT